MCSSRPAKRKQNMWANTTAAWGAAPGRGEGKEEQKEGRLHATDQQQKHWPWSGFALPFVELLNRLQWGRLVGRRRRQSEKGYAGGGAGECVAALMWVTLRDQHNLHKGWTSMKISLTAGYLNFYLPNLNSISIYLCPCKMLKKGLTKLCECM